MKWAWPKWVHRVLEDPDRERSKRLFRAAISDSVVIEPGRTIRVSLPPYPPPDAWRPRPCRGERQAPHQVRRAFADGAGGRFPDRVQVLDELFIDDGEFGFVASWRNPEQAFGPFWQTQAIVRLPAKLLRAAAEQPGRGAIAWAGPGLPGGCLYSRAELELYQATARQLKSCAATWCIPCPADCAC